MGTLGTTQPISPYIIKTKSLEQGDKSELAAIEASSSAPMQNFGLQIGSYAQLHSLVGDVVSTLPWDIQQAKGDYLYKGCHAFLNKLWDRPGNDPYFSEKELDDALTGFLQTISDESDRRAAEWILGGMIRKFDLMHYYSYEINPDLQIILDETEVNYPDLNMDILSICIDDFKARVKNAGPFD